MRIPKIFLFLEIIMNMFSLMTAQWCVSFKSVIKTRVQWNNGQRLLSQRKFFGGIKYKYEPYVYSTVQNYHDYERVSVCCPGYTAAGDNKCEPVCTPSCPANTNCIRPAVCECNTGYRGFTATAYHIQCEPFCRPACMENAVCIEPDKCSCNEGYEKVYNASGSGICQPICQKECPENSSCTKPNQCTCNAGYLDNGWGQCKPVCSEKCPENSECTKPDTCTCHKNYKKQDNLCEPICEQECPQFAHCIRPNECDCVEGYEASEVLNASTTFKCKAKCPKGCPTFANCTQPNVCECQSGYRKTNTTLCTKEHNNCDNGVNLIEQLCEPVCEKSCPEHAYCSEPNKCICEAGYQLKLSSIYNLYCEPVCQSNCSSFGKCVQPNKCECLKGYEMNESDECRPVCSRGCKNGLCFQPEVCICNPGYLMGPQEECEPACSMPCQNGSCIEPEICQCNEGFQFQNNSINVCDPVCKPECLNGICAGPNVCICHENYEPTKTDAGLNHSHCQLIQISSTELLHLTEETTTKANVVHKQDLRMTTTSAINSLETLTTLDSIKENPLNILVSHEICTEQCKCWQEFDDFGPLMTKQCTNLCVDNELDAESCLDLKLCECDSNKTQLICRASHDELISDDPIFYMCNLLHVEVTTTHTVPNSESISSDIKSVQPTEHSTFSWWWVVIFAVFITLCIMSASLYVYFRKVEDPILEYEL